MNFTDLSNKEQEKIMISEIIRNLKKLGGYATKRELLDAIKKGKNTIDEKFFEEEKVSQKSGKIYKPSDYTFNFSAKSLLTTGYLSKPKQSTFELTELGRKVKLDEHFASDIQQKAIQFWKNEKKSKQFFKLSFEKELKHSLDDSKENWRVELTRALKSMSPQKFETFARGLVKEMGVKLDEKIGVSYTNDGGLDGFGYITSTDDFRTNRVAIQAKRWENNVPSPEIDKFRGAMDKYNAEYGIFITTSDFSRSAIEAARQGTRVITLINGEDIADLVAKYKLHVREVTTYELGDFYHTED